MKSVLKDFVAEINEIVDESKDIELERFRKIDDEIEIHMTWNFKLEERDSKLILVSNNYGGQWLEIEWPGTIEDYHLFLDEFEQLGTCLPEIIIWAIRNLKEKQQ